MIEYKIAMQVNRAIDKSLVIEMKLHQYKLYNTACKQKQYFKCHQNDHIMIYYTNTLICGYYAANHLTKDCKEKSAKNIYFTQDHTKHETSNVIIKKKS